VGLRGIPGRAPLGPVVVSLLALAGCDGGTRGLQWSVVFEPESLGDRASMVEARIVSGGCGDGDLRFVAEVRPSEMEGMAPPALEAGRYGFAARALDSQCRWYARGCEPLELGSPQSPRQVQTVLREQATPEARCAPARCMQGRCTEMDAGVAADASSGEGGADGAVPCERQLLGYQPSNVDACGLDPSASLDQVVVEGGEVWLFNTDTGEVRELDPRSGEVTTVRGPGEGVSSGAGNRIGYYRRPPGGGSGQGAPLGVFTMRGLQVRSGAILAGHGDGQAARALVLLVKESVRLEGRATVSAGALVRAGLPEEGPMAGAGHGVPGGQGEGPGGGPAGSSAREIGATGGAGGSFGGRGGAGGGFTADEETDIQPGPQPVQTYGAPSLIPLFGGSAGGGSELQTLRVPGGSSGGALQISAGGALTLGTEAEVRADGGGGAGGRGTDRLATGGAGGGSGGAVLLEAPDVTLRGSGLVSAHGGGGGGGGSPLQGDGDRGQHAGAIEEQCAAGGEGTGESGARGGEGSGCPEPTEQGDSGHHGTYGGGGGGGAGRIRINTEQGDETFLDGLRPGMDTGLATVGRLGQDG
jgi:hypothetical protein